MIKNNNKILIFIIVFIVCLVLLELYFNTTNLFVENFQAEESAARNYIVDSDSDEQLDEINGDNRKNDMHIRSIVSKYSGKVLNVDAIGEPPTNKVLVPFFDSKGDKLSLSTQKYAANLLYFKNISPSGFLFSLYCFSESPIFCPVS